MRHKLGIAILAALMALAGTREAYQQLDGLKTSVGEWTRNSILGNLLVSAASGETADAPPAQQPTVLLAQSHTPCPFERARALAQSSQLSQPRRADARAANADHARAAAQREAAPRLGEFALNLGAARHGSPKVDERTREELIVRAAPQIAELTNVLGSHAEVRALSEAAHTREISEADRARVAAEWKRLGLRKVFVRVAREGGARTEKSFASPAPASFDPRAFASAFTFKTITGLDEATDAPPAPRANEASHDAPSDDELSDAASPNSGFDSDGDCPAARPSLDCDGDPLG
ncbi:MAG: hypothetical protein LC746_07155 [Acidobacteria bacterium]|nr:hypothetical protein [Acidobacteriota bacterium]